MAEQAVVVRSQLIALEALRLVLPNTAIAEVIAYTHPDLPDGMPDWFLGYVPWRGNRIPVVSFEGMVSQAPNRPNKRSRIIVLNSISGDADRSFYGILATGIPRLMSVDNNSILDAPEIGEADSLILRQVIVEKHAAVIPDQYELEARLKTHDIKLMPEE